MRISDWSSDVCSSDLGVGVAIDRYDDLFGRKAQLLCRALQDAHIGLVRNNPVDIDWVVPRSEAHTSELQSLMRISYAAFCLKKKRRTNYLYVYSTRKHDYRTLHDILEKQRVHTLNNS